MTNDMRVSSQWYHRPDDQRFISLHTMHEACLASAKQADTNIVNAKDIRIQAYQKDADTLLLELPGKAPGSLSHWAFGQVCGLLKAPASYLRKLPAPLAAINLQYGLTNHREEMVKTYSTINGHNYLRAITGPDYGRIYDYEVVEAVRRLAGDGVSETRWRVPGYFGKPLDAVTKENTTLYASDRDVFIFLVDEQNPIEIGRTDDGKPDVLYRGFYVWNSEVGSRSFGIATFLYRGVCENRIIWGQRDFKEITLRHSKLAPARFVSEARPALENYANGSSASIIEGVIKAKNAVVARNDEQGAEFLVRRGFTQPMAKKVMEAVITEEGHNPRSVWDFVQGITAVARDIPHQDARVDLERQASKLLKQVA